MRRRGEWIPIPPGKNGIYQVLMPLAAEYKKKNRQNMTPAEKQIRRLLCKAKIRFNEQKIFFYNGTFGLADFYVNSYKTAIEVDGGYHNSPEQQQKDQIKAQWLLAKRRVNTLRIANETAFTLSPDTLRLLLESSKSARSQMRKS